MYGTYVIADKRLDIEAKGRILSFGYIYIYIYIYTFMLF